MTLSPAARRVLTDPGVWIALAAAVGLAVLGLTRGPSPAWAFAAAALMLLVAALSAERSANRAEPPAATTSTADAGARVPLLAAVEVHPDPLAVIVERQGASPVVDYANAAARETLRLRPQAPLVASLRHPRVLDAVQAALERGAAADADYQPPGQPLIWRAFASRLPPVPGEPTKALLVFRDETDARVRERAGADFLANASHELRTPLASLSGFIETLRGHARDDPAAQERFLGIMADQADRMARLVEDLLSLSRIELNEHVPPQGSVDMSLAAADVVDALTVVAGDRQVRLELSGLPRGEAVVEGERDQLLQVMQNLVDNAMKYSPAGSVVEIAVEAPVTLDEALDAARPGSARMTLLAPVRSRGARYAAVRIRDHGPGLAREHLPRLAERFYRAEARERGGPAGTGLGLAIVKHILNRHRGGLAVESLAGEGSVFTACVPLRRR